jgi:hypothetical protein
VAYRADIEIAVRGAQELKRLGDQINATSKLVNNLNNYLENIGTGGVVRNINNLQQVVSNAAAALNEAALGTKEATLAAQNYVAATSNLNSGLREKLQLLKQVNEAERQQRLSSAGIRETTQFGEPIGPGQASSVALSSQLRGRTEQILAERKGAAELTAVLQNLNEQQRQLENSKLDAKAAQIQQELDQQAAAAAETATQIDKLNQRQTEFIARTDAAAAAARRQTAEFYRQQRLLRQAQTGFPASTVEQGPGGPSFSGGFTAAQRQQANEQAILRVRQEQNKIRRQNLELATREELFELRLGRILERNLITEKQRARTREAASNAIIGGAFPLLFGQGAGAALGGGIGGFAGGMAGGQLGFGLSLVGTAVGSALDQTIQSAQDFAKALREGGDAAAYLEQRLGYLNPTIKTQLQNLQASGQTAKAAELAFAELAKTMGTEGASAFLELGKQSEQTSRSLGILIDRFVGAGYAANRFFQEMKFGPGGSFIDFLPQQLRPAPVPATPAETAAATQRTAELTRSNDLLRLQVALTAVSAKTDLERFVTLRKQSAQKEYENELTKISIQLKNEEINLAQNEQLIRGANLRLSVQLGDIERTRIEELRRRNQEAQQAAKQAADERIQQETTALNLQSQILSVFVDQTKAQVATEAFVKGELAGLEAQLKIQNDIDEARLVALDKERRSALLGAETAQQQDLINNLYDRRLDLLQRQNNLEAAQAERSANRLRLEKELANIQRTRDIEDTLRPVQRQQQNVAFDIAAFTTPQDQLERERLVFDQRLRAFDAELQIQRTIADLTKEINSGSLNAAALQAKQADLAAQQQKLTLLTEELTLLDQLEQRQLRLQQFFTRYGQLIQTVSGEIANVVTFGISEIIRGTKTTEQVFAEFLQAVGNALLQAAQQMIAQYIAIGIARIFAGLGGGIFGSSGAPDFSGAFSGGPATGLSGFTPGLNLMPGLANGGPVSAGGAYVVGERGPELFVPSTGGGVMSNNDLRAAMNSSGAGGSGSPVLNMSFETTTIGGVEYVSREQLEQAMAETRRAASRDGAQRGMTMTLDRIQNSSSTRRRIGV